jgi:hypothetical protein
VLDSNGICAGRRSYLLKIEVLNEAHPGITGTVAFHAFAGKALLKIDVVAHKQRPVFVQDRNRERKTIIHDAPNCIVFETKPWLALE